MIYTITLNPAVDRELIVDNIEFNTVLRAADYRVDCGGKGFNVARMLKSLGVASVALGFAAGKNGDFLNESLQSLEIETDFVWVDGETRTNISIISSGENRYLKVNEPGPVISSIDIKKLIEKVTFLAQPHDWWILAGSLPPGVQPDIYKELASIIQSSGAKVIIDTSDQCLVESCKVNPFMIKPNDEEAQALTGLPINSPEDLAATGFALKNMGPEYVVISLGKKGALLIDEQTAYMATPPQILEQNPIGAGDAMVAGMVWGLEQGLSISDSLCRGIASGAATAGQKGTLVGTKEQVNQLLPQIQLSKI